MKEKALTVEEIARIIEEAPKVEPISKFERCNNYIIDGQVVYLPDPAYDAYTLPTYDEEEQSFSWTKFDMDNDFRREDEILCCLDDLKDRKDFEEIKMFYGIKN